VGDAERQANSTFSKLFQELNLLGYYQVFNNQYNINSNLEENKTMASQASLSWKSIKEIELPAAADLHVHLRDGPRMQAVTPTIRVGGVNTVFVMVILCT
jgi:hypothetical protein